MTRANNSRRSEFRFTPEHLSAFLAISHARNPLHVDADYSKRTQFGRPVVYGVGGILAILGAWAEGKRFKLDSVRAQFKKPLFVGENYTFHISDDGARVEAQILNGDEIHSRI